MSVRCVKTIVRVSLMAVTVTALSACGLFGGDDEDEMQPLTAARNDISGPVGSGAAAMPAAAAAVNNFLWRAALDTVGFMPIASADPFGGVILTDWYTPPNAPNERMKVNVTILDSALRADGVRAAVFRQTLDGTVWRDAPVAPETNAQLEDTILTRARQLRVAQTPAK